MKPQPPHSNNPVIQPSSFWERCVSEWRRLNPRFGVENCSLRESIVAGMRQGVYGYFAPVRMLWWLCFHCWRKNFRREPFN